MASKTVSSPMPGAGKPAGVLTNAEPEATSADERIRILAYLKWEAAGKPCSDGVCYWLEAERELVPPETQGS